MKTIVIPPRPWRLSFASIWVTFLLLTLTGSAPAAVKTWSGAVNGIWSVAANWAGGVAPVNGDDLVFPSGAARTTITNDYATLLRLRVNSISFTTGIGYILRGNSLTVSNNLTASHASPNVNTVEFGLTSGTNQTFQCVNAGASLILSGAINLGGSTVTCGGSGSLTLGGVISGTGGITKTGGGTLTLSGAADNTFAGDTLVNEGLLLLAKSSGQGVPGDLVVGINSQLAVGATARFLNSYQIVRSATVNHNSVLDLNGFTESFAVPPIDDSPVLRLNGGGDVQTGAGLLRLPPNSIVLVDPGASGSSTISGRLGLDGSNPAEDSQVFAVGSVALLGAVPLTISAVVENEGGRTNGLTKSGLGEMRLSGNNIFVGPVTVNDGRLTVASSAALGAANPDGVTVNSNASLAIDGSLNLSTKPLYLKSSSPFALEILSGSSRWGSVFEFFEDAVVNVHPGAVLKIDNVVTGGDSRLTKTGAGQLILAGSTANHVTNTTTVAEGTLILSNTGFNQTIVGPLIIGDGVGGADADVVRLGRVRQIGNNIPVTIHSSGLLDLNGLSDAFGALSGYGRVNLNGGILEANYPDATSTFDGVISGAGDFYKDGTGTLTLNGNNTYTGTTVLYADALTPGGPLLVNGSQPQSPVAISNGCTLGGTGVVGTVTVASGGTVSPGASTGILTSSNVTWSAGSTFRVELNGATPGTGHDQINVRGLVSLGGATLNVSVGFTPEPGQSFVILNNDFTDAVSGTFAGLANGATLTAGGFTFLVRYNGGSGNDIVLADTRPPAPLVPFGSVWKYLDDGSDQGAGWRATNFNDSAWAAGPAQLGYGDGDEATVVSYGPNPSSKYVTTYFRRAFTVVSPADFGCLLLRLVRDDGVVVYLNGVEVLRDNLPAGTVTNGTPATTFLAAPYETNVFVAGISAAALVTGTNVLAVEIHQSDAFSTDISFDLELTGSLAGGPACVQRRVWNGPAGNQPNNLRWTRPANWVGNAAPSPGDILHFPAGAMQLTNLNDFSAGTRFHSLEFGGLGYRLQGAGVVVENGLTEIPQITGTGSNVLELALTLATNQSVTPYFSGGSYHIGDVATGGHVFSWDWGNGTIAGGLSGGGGLVMVPGTNVRLAGTNTHTGTNFAGGSSLVVDGAVTASTILLTSGSLSGTGTLSVIQCAGGLLAPGVIGAAAGTLTASNVTLSPSATFSVRLENTNGGHSRLSVFGPVNLGGAQLAWTALAGFTPAPDHATRIIDNDGADAVQGTFDGLPEGEIILIANLPHFVSYRGGDGNDVVLTVVNPVASPLSSAISSGNGNAYLDPNECSLLNIVLTNSAADTTAGIQVTLLSDTPGVTVTQPFSAYPDMPVASRRTNTTPFQISVAPDFFCGAAVALRVRVQTANHGTYFVPVPMTNGSPVAATPLRFDDSNMTNNIIPGQTLRRFISVSGFTGAVGRVEFALHAYGTANQNLDIYLVGPDGTRVELSTDNGGGSNAYGLSCDDADRTRFSDAASVSITSSTFTSFSKGIYRPEGLLAAFAGKSGAAVNGTWTLEVTHDTFSIPDVNGRFRCSSLFLYPAECTPGTGGCELCPDGTVAGAVGVSSPTHAGILVTNGVASACGAPKSCPGTLPSGTSFYQAHVYRGGPADACLTAALTVLGGSLDCVIYTNTFTPANLCANYLADAGLRATPGQNRSCSFNIASNQTFTVVVSGTPGSSYTLAVTGGDCQPRVSPPVVAGPNAVVEWSTALVGYQLEGTNRIPAGPGPWPPVTNPPVIVNGRYRVTTTGDGTNQYFRLNKPAP